MKSKRSCLKIESLLERSSKLMWSARNLTQKIPSEIISLKSPQKMSSEIISPEIFPENVFSNYLPRNLDQKILNISLEQFPSSRVESRVAKYLKIWSVSQKNDISFFCKKYMVWNFSSKKKWAATREMDWIVWFNHRTEPRCENCMKTGCRGRRENGVKHRLKNGVKTTWKLCDKCVQNAWKTKVAKWIDF